MKKIFAGMLAGAIAFSCAGCVSVDAPDTPEGGLQIVVTNYPAFDFARQVFGTDGGSADIYMLLKAGTESHTYDPSAKDIVRINNCDLFIYNGGESDQWVNSILEGTTAELNTLRMMDVVELREEEHTEGMQTEHDHEDEHEHEHEEAYDEHIWTSPKNAAEIVDAIRDEAVVIDDGNAAAYNANADAYIAQINDLDARFTELLSGEERSFIFGDRFPLLYFFKEYDLDYYAAFPGCGSNVEPSAQTISFLLEKLGGEDVIPAVFTIELSSGQIADTLAEDSGLPVYEFHACHNITADDFAAGETYVSLMERNYETLKNILS